MGSKCFTKVHIHVVRMKNALRIARVGKRGTEKVRHSWGAEAPLRWPGRVGGRRQGLQVLCASEDRGYWFYSSIME